MNNYIIIGQQIKTLREQYDLSQIDFAERINTSPNKISTWEKGSGESIPAAKVIFSIVKEFNVSSDWLLYGKESNDSIHGENLTSIHLKLMGLLKDSKVESNHIEGLPYDNLSEMERNLVESFRDLEYEDQMEIIEIINSKLDE